MKRDLVFAAAPGLVIVSYTPAFLFLVAVLGAVVPVQSENVPAAAPEFRVGTFKGWNCDPVFHEQAVQRTAAALVLSLKSTRRVTHLGTGLGRVEQLACNRRVVRPDGTITWDRGSASGDILGAPDMAWKTTQRQALQRIEYRVAKLRLPARDTGEFSPAAMQATLANPNATRWKRISAALGLSWRQRVDAGQPLDVSCVDLNFGATQFAILPAESFVGFQLAAQQLRAHSFVMIAGFGDGAPGYLPTDSCWRDGYADNYCWVPPLTGQLILDALAEALGAPAGKR